MGTLFFSPYYLFLPWVAHGPSDRALWCVFGTRESSEHKLNSNHLRRLNSQLHDFWIVGNESGALGLGPGPT